MFIFGFDTFCVHMALVHREQCTSVHLIIVAVLLLFCCHDCSDENVLYMRNADSLGALLSPEILEGDNQYNCEHCNGKRDATRQLIIRQLPPILCLSLQRFVFDMKVCISVGFVPSKLRLESCFDGFWIRQIRLVLC